MKAIKKSAPEMERIKRILKINFKEKEYHFTLEYRQKPVCKNSGCVCRH